MKKTTQFFLLVFIMLTTQSVTAQISGVVFRDFNANGVKDNTTTFNESFVAGVTIKAYNAADALVATTTSSATGAYSFTGLALPLRIEFSGLQTGDYTAPYSAAAGGNTSSVQFYTASTTTANFAVNYPGDFSQANPRLVIPMLDQGNFAGNTRPGIASFLYNTPGVATNTGVQIQYAGPAANLNNDFNQSVTGSTWGVSYQKDKKRVFASTYLKRGSAIVDGPGFVYILDYAAATPTLAHKFNLQGTTTANGGVIDLGTVNRTYTTAAVAAGAAGDNQIPPPTFLSRDIDAFGKISKMSFGDNDITEDGKTLWLVNLFQRSLIKVDVSNTVATAIPAAGAVNQYILSALPGYPAAPTTGILRPWGLKFYRGKGYLGVVNDASTGTRANLVAYVLSFDPNNIAAGFTTEITVPLGFQRSDVNDRWKPWLGTTFTSSTTANTADFVAFASDATGGGYKYAQPILSDIEFEPNGNMLLGFRDRTGDQFGSGITDPTSGTTVDRFCYTRGDLLKACKSGSTYTIEGGAGCNVNYAGVWGVSNNGEFFIDNIGDGAQEGLSGGLAIYPGTNEIVSTVLDPQPVGQAGYVPAYASSQGIHRNNLTNGAQTAYYQMEPSSITRNGKGNGLGDIEILSDAPSIEIGNRVWNDLNADGIQEPGEVGIAGVVLELTDAAGNPVDSDPVTAGIQATFVTTDANGNWYITSAAGTDATGINYGVALLPNTAYKVKLATSGAGNDWDPTANGGAGGPRAASDLVGYNLTKTNSVGAGLADFSDNDATKVASIPEIAFTTGEYGQNNHTLDMGFTKLASLGNRVWLDEGAGGGTRNNGIQDGSEPGVSGVVVMLYQNGPDGIAGNDDDVLVGSTITDSYGMYMFNNLQPSSSTATQYNVRVTTPANYTLTQQTNTTDDNNTTGVSTTGSDVNALGVSYSIDLSAGENNPNIDAGLVFSAPVLPNSIGDKVWLDTNNDGSQSAGEPGVAGVTVTLYDAAGNIYAITKTDANGNYLFNNLPPNTNYTVGFSAPAGTVLVPASAATPGGTLSTGNATTNSDPNPTTGLTTVINTGAAGNKITGVDAGLQNDSKGSLGNFVWNDINNSGTQDAGEPGIPGVVMRLYGPGPDGVAGGGDDVLLATTTTDGNGYYVFPNLDPGKYFVVAAPIPGYVVSNKDQGTDDTKDSDFVTNATYPGSSVSSVYTLSPAGTAGVTRDMTVDLGVHTNTTGLNTLGNFVWNDINKNGIQDLGELGVPNVTVRLLNSAGAPFNNPTTGKPYVVTTDANGNYKFVDLPDGNYIVEFANIPAGYSFTGQDAAGSGNAGSASDTDTDSDAKPSTGRTSIIDVDAASGSLTSIDIVKVDAGISQGVAAGTASLGNRVWYDNGRDADGAIISTKANNGIQDAGELGVANVKVELLDGTGAVVNIPGTSTPYIVYTNALGEYLFTGLPAGDYTVRFSRFPAGFTSSPAITTNTGQASDATDADASFTGTSVTATTTATTGVYSLQTGEDNLTVDMGIVPAAGTNSLGNFVWKDANSDGKQDLGELGVQGVTVTLYNNGPDGLPGTADDVLVGVTTTDNNGAYGFIGLPDGNYNVGFTNLPAGFVYTDKDKAGSTPTDGSDANVYTGRTNTYALDPTSLSLTGVNDPTVDGGIISTRAALGNYVWLDTNGDGVQDLSEKGISGVTVTLFAADGTTVLASTITDADGKYFFGNLLPGSYIVGFSSIPSNLSFTQQNTPGDNQNNTNSDADIITGKTGVITLSAGETDLTVDAGLKPEILASVGDFVWIDKDGNGRQDAGEPGLPGILVTLKDNLGNVVGTAITDGNGKYLIDNVKPGTGFTITFSNLPASSTFTGQNTGITNATNGSDANSLGVTAPFNLVAGQYLPDIDAGIINVQLLPIKLISFTALPKGNAVSVDWKVDYQDNVSKYEVLYSTDGINFSVVLANIAATTNTAEAYNILHSNVANGINYYKIRITEKDGAISYSDVRKVNFGKAGTLSVYPNPATTVINITLTGTLIDKAATITLLSADGKIVSKSNIVKTGQTESINVSKLANGTYFIKVTTATEVIFRTIQVIR